jgi:Cation transport ATPase
MAQGQDKAALKAAKKEERVAKRAKRKETRGQMWQAFQMQRKQDKALIPLMLLSILGMGLLFFLIGLLFNGQWFMLILGLGVGFLIAMIFLLAAWNAICTSASKISLVCRLGFG